MKKVLVVAPHADDEALGCAGTILRHIAEGDEVYWLLVTELSLESGFSKQQIDERQKEIADITQLFDFKQRLDLKFPPAKLDTIPQTDIICALAEAIDALQPEVIYTVFGNDVHSDHRITFDCLLSASKSFRHPSIKKILAYETLSETDFSSNITGLGFQPNVFTNIEDYLDKKLQIISRYQSEIADFPFPRSLKAITALAHLRGVQANCKAAEAFMLIKEIN